MKTATFSALLLLHLAGGRAAAQDEKARLDPNAVIMRLQEAYRTRPFAESVDIDALGQGEHKRETVRIESDGHANVRLEIDPLIVWTDAEHVYAVHQLNAGLMFRADLNPADRAGSFHAAIPSLPLPQVDLALAGSMRGGAHPPGKPPAASEPWSPLTTCPIKEWEMAQAMRDHSRIVTTMRGEGGNCKLALALIGDPPRFVQVKAITGTALGEVTLKVERLEEHVTAEKIPEDVRGRTLVPSLGELAAAPDDVKPGLAMPKLVAAPVVDTGGKPFLPAKGGYALLLTREPASEASASLTRFAQLQKSAAPGLPLRAVLVSALGIKGATEELHSAAKQAGAEAWSAVSYSPRTTIDRFASKASSVVVVVGGDGLVQAIMPPDDPKLGEAMKSVGAPR